MSEVALSDKTCRFCGKVISRNKLRYARVVFCSRNCARDEQRQRYRALNQRLDLPTATVGAIGELAVAIDLLRRGYEVFRALSPSCSCDLAVIHSGKLVRIEVRTAYRFGPQGELRGTAPKVGRADVWALVHGHPPTIKYEPDVFNESSGAGKASGPERAGDRECA